MRHQKFVPGGHEKTSEVFVQSFRIVLRFNGASEVYPGGIPYKSYDLRFRIVSIIIERNAFVTLAAYNLSFQFKIYNL